jgi:hypothetical protein
VPVIVTTPPVEAGKTAIGRTWEGYGVVLETSDSDTLSHELGHFAGYVGNDEAKNHSTTLGNLMHDVPPLVGKSRPDPQWCKKVAALFK